MPVSHTVAQSDMFLAWVTLVCLQTAPKSNNRNHVFSLGRVVHCTAHSTVHAWEHGYVYRASLACCTKYHKLLNLYHITEGEKIALLRQWASCKNHSYEQIRSSEARTSDLRAFVVNGNLTENSLFCNGFIAHVINRENCQTFAGFTLSL